MYLPDLPREARPPEPAEPHATERGSCPHCGSAGVVASSDDHGATPG